MLHGAPPRRPGSGTHVASRRHAANTPLRSRAGLATKAPARARARRGGGPFRDSAGAGGRHPGQLGVASRRRGRRAAVGGVRRVAHARARAGARQGRTALFHDRVRARAHALSLVSGEDRPMVDHLPRVVQFAHAPVSGRERPARPDVRLARRRRALHRAPRLAAGRARRRGREGRPIWGRGADPARREPAAEAVPG